MPHSSHGDRWRAARGARNDEAQPYQATDLSTTGVWFQTARPYRTGETICVCFNPDAGQPIMVFGEVARVATQRHVDDNTPGIGMGVEFLDLTPREALRLSSYLAKRRQPIPRRRRPVRRLPASEPPRKTCWR